MIPFLAMLQGAGGAGAAAGGSRIGQAMGAKGSSFIKPSDKNVGMQFMNAGINPPEVPNMMNMLMGANQMTKPGGPAGKLPVFDILSMLRGGR